MGKTALLVLAAGMGSRFGGIKQASPVGPAGETILEFSVFDALRAGFDEVVFLISSSIEGDFRDRVVSRLPASLHHRLAFQEAGSLLDEAAAAKAKACGRTKPWGTGHALMCAASELRHPFASVNADDYYGPESFRLVHDFLASADPAGSSWCMAGFALANTVSPNGPVSRGICAQGPGGMLRGVTEYRAIERGEGGAYVSATPGGAAGRFSGDELVSMNLWGFTPRIFGMARGILEDFFLESAGSAAAEFYLPDIVDTLIARGEAEVRVLPTPERWFGLTYRADVPESASRIEELTAAGLYPRPLWS
jgi:hypothetical protein